MTLVQGAADQPGVRRRVLVLEDDEDILESIAAILDDAGYSVVCSRNGLEALERLREDPADIIVLDLMMPVMDGWEFRAAQKADRAIAGIPVIVITADSSAKAAAIHSEGFLAKPFSASDLLATIERVLTERERRRLSERLEETSRLALLGTIAAGVGHEINNPLSFVLGNLELSEGAISALREDASALRGGTEVPRVLESLEARLDALASYLRDSHAGLERVRLVVRNLQSLSRRPSAERSHVDLRAVLEASISMAWSHIRYRAVLNRSYENLPEIWGNASRLGQVFLNLLVNASQSIESGRVQANEIRVAVRRQENFAVIEIADTGQGMSPALLSRIFEPFFTTKGQGDGTGLGLSICKEIVEEHGGRIEMHSVVERGSRAVVYLPIATSGERRAAAPPAAADSVPPAQLVRSTAWVVDDEPLVAQVISRFLRNDYEVLVADGPRDVLRRIAAGERFDVLICDVMMPDMSGVELGKLIARDWPELASRIVFVSGGVLSKEMSDFIHEPGRTFLDKPFDARSLGATIRRVVAHDAKAKAL